jgi:hypothetical protein
VFPTEIDFSLTGPIKMPLSLSLSPENSLTHQKKTIAQIYGQQFRT